MKHLSLPVFLRHTIYGRQDGVSLAEFALILPIFLLILLGMVDMGRGFNTYIGLLNATREGAFSLANSGDDLTHMNNRIENELRQIGLTTGDVTVTRTPDKNAYESGDLVTVKIMYPYDLLFGDVTGFPSLTIRAENTVRILPQ